MDPAGRGRSRAERVCRVGYRERLEDLRIRLSRKYEFNLAEAFDPCRMDNTTTKPSEVARPTSIDSALFLCPFPARIESLVAMVRLHHSLLCAIPSRPLFLIPISWLSIFLTRVLGSFRSKDPKSCEMAFLITFRFVIPLLNAFYSYVNLN